MQKQIAQFLNLNNPETYTGHSFRRISATLIAASGANITTLKRHGGWKSTTVTEGYIEESIKNKTKISKIVSSSINLPSTSREKSLSASPPSKLRKTNDMSEQEKSDHKNENSYLRL